MNINISPIQTFVRSEYITNHKEKGRFFPCVVFGVASIPGQVPLFHILMEDGGLWWRLPISAFSSKQESTPIPLGDLVLWNSFSYQIDYTEYGMLQHSRMIYRDSKNVERGGTYIGTLDWTNDNQRSISFAETPDQHKCAHIIHLDCGNYALQPNNRVLVRDMAFTPKFNQIVTKRYSNETLYSVEYQGLASEEYYYKIKAEGETDE